MKAQDVPLIQLLDGAKQFVVPIFQRDYSWGTKHCQQLWNDILRVGADPNSKAHFLGSVVYIPAEDSQAAIPRWLVIDGQQRLTTVTLLLIALRDQLIAEPSIDEVLVSPEEINDYYLLNRHGKGAHKNKLTLRRADNNELTALLSGGAVESDAAETLRENYEFFRNRLVDVDAKHVYAGISKLVVVDVSLKRGHDDPQMIFESLNSTGLDLTQADLIRNFVLMRLDDELQTRLYETYWRPIEIAFGSHYRSEFDEFCRDYLTLMLKPSKQFKADSIYHHFREYFLSETRDKSVENFLHELQRYANYYVRFRLGKETDELLAGPSTRLRKLVKVASPLMLRLHDCHEQNDQFNSRAFKEAIEIIESYIFRRSVCDMQTRSLNQIFASLAYAIQNDDPLTSLKIALYRSGKKRRFPTDIEFCDAYTMRHHFYLLDRLENDSKEKIDTSSFTVEHVLPQNQNLGASWREMLGSDWKTIQETWLHRLGNLTLTGYNSVYSDRSFTDKKTMEKGFDESPLRINHFIRESTKWTVIEIEERGKRLSKQASKIWPMLVVDIDTVRQVELEEHQMEGSNFSIDSIGFDAEARALFDNIRPQILALGDDVFEQCGEKSVVYRVFDHFVEILPRAKYILLLVNTDFEDTDDPSGIARDASDRAFVTNASKSGGVLFSLRKKSQSVAAVHVLQQAYERVTE